MPREIHVNAFDMNCVGHIQHGLWRHPRDQSTRYLDLKYWTAYARKLEAGLFDGVFFADVIGVYDVYGASPDAAVRGAVQVPVNDPMLLIPAMAAAPSIWASASPATSATKHRSCSRAACRRWTI